MAWYKTREEIVEMVEIEPHILANDDGLVGGEKVALVIPLNGKQTTMDLDKFREKYEPTREPTKAQRDLLLGTESKTATKPKRERKPNERKALGNSPLSPEPNGQVAEA